MLDLGELRSALSETARQWLDEAREGLEAKPESLAVLFPQLPRRIGREHLAQGRIREGDAVVEQGAWRMCDAAGLALLQVTGLQAIGAGDDVVVDLFLHGDLEERTMVLRSLAVLPVTDATLRLLEEVQRTNTTSHFEAALCDSNLAVRALLHPGFSEADFNRLILKLAFLDIPLDRVFEAQQRANPELSRMLRGLATERQAAGRPVWGDTERLIALAPISEDTKHP